MIPTNLRKKIVDEANITEIISEYLPLKKTGNSNFAVCPFHDDHKPSMSVSDKVKMFNCFTCGAKGDVVTFVSKYEHISIDQACVKLAKKLNIPISVSVSKEEAKMERLTSVMKEAANFYSFYLLNSEEGIKGLEYLNNRGITKDIIEKYNIGLAPSISDGLYQYLKKKNISELDMIDLGLVRNNEKNIVHDVFRTRIMFPVTSPTGAIVAFSGRVYTDSDQAKYINSNETAIFHKGEVLYNFHEASLSARKFNKIYLFEGFMDVIAAYKAGIENGVATMGTALTRNHINMLLSLTNNIVLCFDGDAAGIKAMNRSAELLSGFNVIPESIVLPNNMDPDEYGKAYGFDKLFNYLSTKSENVYSQLYNLAYKNLVKGDIQSIEKFKNTVFEFLNYVRQETLIDHFVNRLATDLEVSVESIKDDYSKVKKDFVVDNSIPQNVVESENIPTFKYEKKVKVTLAVKKAYRIIIKHSLYNNKDNAKYFDATNRFYPGNELALEYAILSRIKDLYYEYPNLTSNDECASFIFENMKNDPMYFDYLSNIYNDTNIDINNNDDFEQCILTIKNYINKVSTALQKNRVKNGEIGAIDDFIKSKKHESGLDDE